MHVKPMLALAVLCGLSSAAHADRPHIVAHVKGYTCMSLKQTPEQAMDFNHPPMFKTAPRPDAPDALPAMSLVAVKDGAKQVNGFVEVLQWNRSAAWIKSSNLEPFHAAANPSARCIVAEMSNGHIDFDTH